MEYFLVKLPFLTFQVSLYKATSFIVFHWVDPQFIYLLIGRHIASLAVVTDHTAKKSLRPKIV